MLVIFALWFLRIVEPSSYGIDNVGRPVRYLNWNGRDRNVYAPSSPSTLIEQESHIFSSIRPACGGIREIVWREVTALKG